MIQTQVYIKPLKNAITSFFSPILAGSSHLSDYCTGVVAIQTHVSFSHNTANTV